MGYLQFLDGRVEPSTALPGTYDPLLVIFSYLFASLAAYVALDIAERVTMNDSEIPRRFWLAGGALTIGSGVWAMHFTGMLAYSLPITITYDPLITAISLIPAVLAGAVMLHIVSQDTVTVRSIALGGVIMGAGIGIMHYVGMAAMRMGAGVKYDPYLFAISVVVAVVLAFCALYVKYWAMGRSKGSNRLLLQVISALVMGLAIAGMHYTAMQSTYCFADPAKAADGLGLKPTIYAIVIAVIVILLAVVSCWIDRERLEFWLDRQRVE